MSKLFYILFILISLAFSNSFGQDCANTLAEAKDVYEQGLLEKVPKILDNCLKTEGFKKAQQIEAYKLLTLTYLFDDQQTKADEAMLQLLKLEPELEVNPAVDPIEFIELFNSYRTLPLYSFGIVVGSNFTVIERKDRYGVEPLSDLSSGSSNFSKYLDKFGFMGGLKANRYLSKNLELNLDILYRINRLDFQASSMFDFATVESKERQSWIYFPLSLTYDFWAGNKKVWPYARLGIGTGIRLDVESELTREYTSVNGVEVLQGGVSGQPVDMKDQRRGLYLWGIAGAGIKYKVKRGYLFADLRYNYGIMNAVNTTNRYSNPELIYQYYYVDDDFSMHSFNFTVGLVRSLYKPKKLMVTSNNKKTKSQKKNKKEKEETNE